MQLGEGVEWAVHACVLLAVVPPDQALPAARLAEYHELPSAYLAKQLQSLAGAGIITSVPRRRGGYRLAPPAAGTTVPDAVRAVEGSAPAFRCSEIRQRGPAAVGPEHYPKPCGVARVMWAAEEAWRSVLAATTVHDLLVGVTTDASPVSIRRAVTWMQEAAR